MGAPDPLEKSFDYLILFDGVCNLCNGAVQFIIKNDPKKKFRFASLQSETGQSILRGHNWQTEVYSIIFVKDQKLFHMSDAVIEIAKDLSWPWKIFYAGKILPKFLRDPIYKLIAHNRYRWFGKQDECWLPSPELKSRFL